MLKKIRFVNDLQAKVGYIFKDIPISPNHITILSIVSSLVGAVCFFVNSKWLGLSFFVLAFIFDAIDGSVARAKNMLSRKGAFLDGVADRIVEFIILSTMFVLAIIDNQTTVQILLFCLLFFGTCMTSFVKAYSEHTNVLDHSIAVSMPGICERSERSLLILFYIFFYLLNQYVLFFTILFILVILSFITVLQRIYFVLKA